jgi:tetratricopeptide (TPR) repeat protein
MIPLLTGVLLSAIAGVTGPSQSSQASAPEQRVGPALKADWHPDKSEVLRLIALNEAAARDGETNHADRKRLIMIYSNLGILYEDAGMFLKAVYAIRQTITLLENGPQDQLANEIQQLAVLYVVMNKRREAEKEEMLELQIRETLADPLGIALNQIVLAALYDTEGKFAKAADYAQKAYDVMADRADVGALDRIGVRHSLGFALTAMRNCDRGINVLKDALELAKNSPGVGITSIGYSEYVLGIGYWHCSDRDHASAWLDRGTTDMRAEFGMDHVRYVRAMQQYAHFLRQTGQHDAAISVEAIVNQAESVVDVSTLTARPNGLK